MAGFLTRTRVMNKIAPAPNWRWTAQMPPIPGAPSSQLITPESIEWPHININSIERYTGSRPRHYAGAVNVGAVTISFYEDEQMNTTSYLRVWQSLVYTEAPDGTNDGVYGMPSNYWKDIHLFMYDRSGRQMLNAILMEAWPTAISPYGLTYTESGRIIVSCSFSANRTSIATSRAY